MANEQLSHLDKSFDALREKGFSDVRFYVGEITDTTAEQFAAEANIILDAVRQGKYKDVSWSDPSIN
jgi:hypothetical protein